MRKNKRKLQGQVVVSAEQYLKQLLVATRSELDVIILQLKTPQAGRYVWSISDLELLNHKLAIAQAQIREVDADSSKKLSLSTGDFT